MSEPEQTILLVDDEQLFLTSLEDAVLSELPSIEVLRAEDGEEALALLAAHDVDVLVTDLRMPRMDGIELLARLTQLGIFVPTLVATAHGTPRIESVATSLGALAFIEKPVDVALLVSLIARRLELPRGGTIHGVSLPGFLQLLSMERKTSVLRAVDGERSGVLVFVDGEVVDARVPGLRGNDAALEMCRWARPVMHVEPSVTSSERTVTLRVEQLLLESARLTDEGWPEITTGELPIASDVLGTLDVSPADAGQSDPPPPTGVDMSNVSDSLDSAMKIGGAIAAALVDFESGLTLGVAGGGPNFDIEAAAAGNTQVVRAKMAVMANLGIDGAIEDILITLDDQIHLIRPLSEIGTLFLYLAISKEQGNLGLARHKLSAIEKQLEI